MVRQGNLVKNIAPLFQQQLKGIYPPEEIRQMLYLLFEEYTGWSKTEVHLSSETLLNVPQMMRFTDALNELVRGKPIQYLLGKTQFNDIIIKVNPGVLIPRPETAELCTLIKEDCAALRHERLFILDIGTGSGCIAIDLKTYFTEAEVTAIDKSEEALNLAAENALASHMEVSFRLSDILDQPSWSGLGHFQLIVSNPPYVTCSEKGQMHRNVLDYEPETALFVPDDNPLLFFTAISAFAAARLAAPALLYLEINERFGKEVGELLDKEGFSDIRIRRDFHGKDRFVSAKMIVPRRTMVLPS